MPTDDGPSAASVLQNFDRHGGADDETSQFGSSSSSSSSPAPYRFTPKFQHSTKNNPLCGICLVNLIKLFIHRRTEIEWRTYWPRLVVITLLSVLNSILALPERFWYERRISETVIHPRPVFILGHPRTGTTLLHSLLALDEDQFAICTTFCAGFPSCFLWFERFGKKLLKGVIDETRPMDNVPLHFDLPQEDELATNLLSGVSVSPYIPLFFMSQEQEFRPYYAFDDATVGEETDEYLPPQQLATARLRWISAFLHLLRKLTLRANRNDGPAQRQRDARRLLLKSPVHTARIPLLLQLFPNAQFLYIHRDPYHVFCSAAHMADTTYWYTYLNTPTDTQIQEFILRQYEILWDRYQAGKILLREDQLVEVSFDDLTQGPTKTIHEIYQRLGWKMSDEYQAQLKKQVASAEHSTYQRNQHHSLTPKLRELIQKRWGPSFDVLGYER